MIQRLLRENLTFRRFWTAQTISLAGDQISMIALPLVAVPIKQALVPDRLRAGVSGAYMVVNYGVRPLGGLAGGWLGSAIGLRETLWLATGGALLGVLFLLPSPLPGMRDLPQPAG